MLLLDVSYRVCPSQFSSHVEEGRKRSLDPVSKSTTVVSKISNVKLQPNAQRTRERRWRCADLDVTIPEQGIVVHQIDLPCPATLLHGAKVAARMGRSDIRLVVRAATTKFPSDTLLDCVSRLRGSLTVPLQANCLVIKSLYIHRSFFRLIMALHECQLHSRLGSRSSSSEAREEDECKYRLHFCFHG